MSMLYYLKLGGGITGLCILLSTVLLVQPANALDRNELSFYLAFEGSYAPTIAPKETSFRLKDFTRPFTGSFEYLLKDNKTYFNPADKTPRKLEFVPGRKGLGLKTEANPTRFKVYSYPCVQYDAQACFAQNEGTIAFWMKPVGWSGLNGHRYFLAVIADNCAIRFYNYPGKTSVWLDGKDYYRFLSSGQWRPGWQEGKWTFLAFTYKPGTQSFYIDGELMEQSTAGLVEPKFIKTGLIEVTEGDQVLDELMIFKRSLNPAEIKVLYRANLPNDNKKAGLESLALKSSH